MQPAAFDEVAVQNDNRTIVIIFFQINLAVL